MKPHEATTSAIEISVVLRMRQARRGVIIKGVDSSRRLLMVLTGLNSDILQKLQEAFRYFSITNLCFVQTALCRLCTG